MTQEAEKSLSYLSYQSDRRYRRCRMAQWGFDGDLDNN